MDLSIDIVLPCADKYLALEKSLLSLKKNALWPYFKVFVVLSGEYREKRELLPMLQDELSRKYGDNIVILMDRAKSGYCTPGSARNTGINACRSDYIAFLDASMEACSDWLAEVDNTVDGLLGNTVYQPNGFVGLIGCLSTYGDNGRIATVPGTFIRRDKCG